MKAARTLPLILVAAFVLFPVAAEATPWNQPPGQPALKAESCAMAEKDPPRCQAKCRTKKCAIRVARKKCSQRRPTSCVRRAALHYRLSFTLLRKIAGCESVGSPWGKINPYAHNPSGAEGAFQFLYGTWAATPYGPQKPRVSAKWASLGAAWLIATDGLHHWTASAGCWR